jgi:predicted DNA-binding transcriptional regulator AlpA
MPLMTEREVAEATGGAISMRRLQNMRVAGEGPPYLKIGKSVRYEWDDVREWLASHKRRSTSDTAREAA